MKVNYKKSISCKDFNGNWTNKTSNNLRSRRDDHSTNHDHPAFDGRIIDGDIANIKQYPFFVALWLNNAHACGGSLINHQCRDFHVI